MKRAPISRYSLSNIEELRAEAPVRVQLVIRAGGTPVERQVTVCHAGEIYTYTKVECQGGICECGCGRASYGGLEPHEQTHRSQSGKLSLENTIMVRRDCHKRLQRSDPMWSRA